MTCETVTSAVSAAVPTPRRRFGVLDAMILLMDRIQNGRGHSQLRTKRDEIVAAASEE